ncbi:MAG TPA: glucoamylase family protein [Candidatus Dormibacteraeota bacterium]|nr:glucoamylase family protein [Candidatus Dormibacteraeota bacterium]
MSPPDSHDPRARRAERRTRDRRALLAVTGLGLVVTTFGFALLISVGRMLLTVAPQRPPEGTVGPIDRGCSPGELVSLDSWVLARIDRTPVSTPRKRLWERALGESARVQAALRARLSGWPSRLVVAAKTLPSDGRQFAERLARDTWRGLDALTDRDTGLPLDTVTFAAAGKGPPAAARIGDYTNVTNIGLMMIDIVGAYELGLIDDAGARSRLVRLLDTLDRLETDDGFFYNYYDTTSLERTSHFISFVDSSWLVTGLMTARMTFPEIYERCTLLIEQMDFGVLYDRSADLMSHGYYVEPRAPSRYHYGVLYTEARLGTLIGIGKGQVPEKAWFTMIRTFPPGCFWQTQPPLDVRTRDVRGYEVTAGYYLWRGVKYVPSWGGSMFEALMPTIVLDEMAAAPKSLGRNGLAHAVIQERFARHALGLPVWGLSPSATPGGDSYGEYGVHPLGSLGYGPGPVTPHASALALATIPHAALRNLHTLATRYRLYGDFGFYDAVDAPTGQVAYKYLALDQSMLFLALVNHLTEHAVQRRFASDPIMERALPVIAAERFFE